MINTDNKIEAGRFEHDGFMWTQYYLRTDDGVAYDVIFVKDEQVSAPKKYRYRWPIIIGVSLLMWAGIVYAVKADGISEASIYANDRAVCNLYVDQNWINEALIRGSIENNITIKQAYDLAAERGTVLNSAIIGTGRVGEYCERRRAK